VRAVKKEKSDGTRKATERKKKKKRTTSSSLPCHESRYTLAQWWENANTPPTRYQGEKWE
jgi:hypothetical protein